MQKGKLTTYHESAIDARQAAEGFIATGALVVQDSRASADANNAFLDLLEDYFDQPDEVLKKDERPEVGYQVVGYQHSASATDMSTGCNPREH